MPGTKSEETVAEAFKAYDEGNIRDCILQLTQYAYRHIHNHRTERIFKTAIDQELADRRIDNVNHPDPDAPQCSHCGSHSTYYRLTDGDIACNNCHGIMPANGGDQ